MQKKRVFITGIAGFIGFHLAKTLLEQGHDIIGIDNFNSYYDVKLKEKREKILVSLGVQVIHGDICDQTYLEKLFALHCPTHLVHLAAQAGVRYSLENPNSYIQSNIIGFFNLLEILKSSPIPFIYASSSSIYGKNANIPFSEIDKADMPTSLYGATKKSNELLAHSYHHLYQIPMTGLRFFTVYGPYGRPDMAYFTFADKILKDEEIIVYGDGTLQRDFTYIDDIVQGIIASIDHTNDQFQIYNLGNNQPQTVNHLIACLEENIGKKAKIKFQPAPKTDCIITYANIEKAKADLGFHPSTTLKEGISKFIAWHTSNLDAMLIS